MPFYRFKNNDTGEVGEEQLMTISEMEQFLKDNPNMSQHFEGAGVGTVIEGRGKPPKDFQQILDRIQNNYPGAEDMRKNSRHDY